MSVLSNRKIKELWDTLNKPKEKFSAQHLVFLCSVLRNTNTTLNYAKNQHIYIETLRQMAELIVWGDQNSPQFFDIFLEKNVLSDFFVIMNSCTIAKIKIQLIQTLSIIIENLRNEMAIFYILSNNHINELILHKFDFGDEDLLTNYISFLKSLSLKLNPQSIQFFYNDRSNDFPLYTEAVKFFNQPESMIRVAVRTLTLNVFKVQDKAMRKFLLDKTAAPYFSNIVWFLHVQCEELNQVYKVATFEKRGKLTDITEELLDLFYYIHDILALEIEELNRVLTFHFIEYLIIPLLVQSLLVSKPSSSFPLSASAPVFLPSGMNNNTDALIIEPKISLYILGQILHIITHRPLVNSIVSLLFHSQSSKYQHLYALTSTLAEYKVVPPSLKRSLTDPNIFNTKNPQPNEPKLVSTPSLTTSSANNVKVPEVANRSRFYSSAVTSPPKSASQASISTTPAPTPAKPRTAFEFLYSSKVKSAPNNAITTPTPQATHASVPTKSESSNDPPVIVPLPASNNTNNAETDLNINPIESNKHHNNSSNPPPNVLPSSSVNNNNNDNTETENWGAKVRAKLLEYLTDGSDHEILGALNLIYAALRNVGTEKYLYEEIGILPFRLAKSKKLLDSLIAKDEESHSLFNSGDNIPISNDVASSNKEPSFESEPTIVSPRSLKETSQFGKELVKKVFILLSNIEKYRIVTCQVAILVVKELLYSDDPSVKIDSDILFHLNYAYVNAAQNLRSRIIVDLGDSNLELFEDEIRKFKRINFDNLVTDATILLPIPTGPTAGVDFSKRMPKREGEEMKKDIQIFLLLRDLKYTLLHKKDLLLPLKENQTFLSEKIKPNTVIDTLEEKEWIKCNNFISMKGSAPCYLLIEGPFLLCVEMNKEKQLIVNEIIELQNLEIAIPKHDPTTILTKFGTFYFENAEKMTAAKTFLDNAKSRIIQSKLDQLNQLLDLDPTELELLTSNSNDLDGNNSSDSEKRGSGIFDSIQLSRPIHGSPSRSIMRENAIVPRAQSEQPPSTGFVLIDDYDSTLSTSYKDYDNYCNDDNNESDGEITNNNNNNNSDNEKDSSVDENSIKQMEESDKSLSEDDLIDENDAYVKYEEDEEQEHV